MKYKVYEEKEIIRIVECMDCLDTGFVFVKINPNSRDTICACECDQGKWAIDIELKGSMMPRFDRELGMMGVKKLKFKEELLQPEFKDTDTEWNAIQRKALWWKEFKEQEKLYWQTDAGKDLFPK